MEQSYSLVFGELWGILGFGLKHHLNKKSIKNIILMSRIFNSFTDDLHDILTGRVTDFDRRKTK